MTTTAASALGARPGEGPALTPKGSRAPMSFARRYGWPIGIAAALLLSAGANILMMIVAKADPAFAIEPDYYAKAVSWDATMAQERTNATLGWRAAATLALASPRTPGRITVTLQDMQGQVIPDATAIIEAMHNARASQRYEATLTPDGSGAYTAPIDAHRPGQWEVRITASRGTDRFTQSLRVEAPDPVRPK